jgi:hypothetical protein
LLETNTSNMPAGLVAAWSMLFKVVLIRHIFITIQYNC